MSFWIFEIKRFFKQLCCHHNYKLETGHFYWSAKDCYIDSYRCTKCGKEKFRYYLNKG